MQIEIFGGEYDKRLTILELEQEVMNVECQNI